MLQTIAQRGQGRSQVAADSKTRISCDSGVESKARIPDGATSVLEISTTSRRNTVRCLIAQQMRELTAFLFEGDVVANTQLNRSRVSVADVLQMQNDGISLAIVFSSASSSGSLDSLLSDCSSTASRKRTRPKSVGFVGMKGNVASETSVVLKRKDKHLAPEFQIEQI
ncbi:hypothetical protein FVE85_0856 [Porphyridium purpureum]|uniref:Uncharacterized protein n=1 Tax=Porphyridium purpureum TaxID=35688 RepID=A0A5J4Z3C3_PORPP|nr:hypothetical protein FVE85_0856 [Porphyridium purpureum]|eukprot:POR0343..scf208_2